MTDYRNHTGELDQQKQILFLSSALLHACIILCFLLLEQPNRLPPFMRDSETVEIDPATATQQAQNPYSPAQLIGSSGNFGAPVSFIDEEQSQGEPEAQQERPTETKKDVAAPTQPANNPEPPIAADSSIGDIFPNIARPNPNEEIRATSQPTGLKTNIQRKQTARKRVSRPIPNVQIDKKKLTFADLAQGFLETMHTVNRQGNAAISQSGDPNKKPDEMDLKYNSYMAKFNWYLQSSSRLYPFRPTPPITQNLMITLYISIDKDGQLKQCDVVQSSGRTDVDKHIEKIIRKAAPFPDIPAHFATTLFGFPMTIGIAASPANIDGEYIFVCQ